MTKHSQETIERVARIVAEALGDAMEATAYSGRTTFELKGLGYTWCGGRQYLSDHRTVARYLAHISEGQPNSTDPENIIIKAMCNAWADPLGAIITLVEKVEEGKEQ